MAATRNVFLDKPQFHAIIRTSVLLKLAGGICIPSSMSRTTSQQPQSQHSPTPHRTTPRMRNEATLHPRSTPHKERSQAQAHGATLLEERTHAYPSITPHTGTKPPPSAPQPHLYGTNPSVPTQRHQQNRERSQAQPPGSPISRNEPKRHHILIYPLQRNEAIPSLPFPILPEERSHSLFHSAHFLEERSQFPQAPQRQERSRWTSTRSLCCTERTHASPPIRFQPEALSSIRF